MMGGETFILLKATLSGPKSAKQAEKRAAVLPTILSIASLRPGRKAARARKNTCLGCIAGDFRWIWIIPLDFTNSVIQITVLAGILAHHPAREGREKMTKVLWYFLYTLQYFK
jgi:hypothetical protein